MSLQDKRILQLKRPSFWLLLIAILLCSLAIFSLITNPSQTKIHNPATQEYIVGASGILGSVDKELFTRISPDFAIGADKYGRAVFIDPHQALATFEILYSDTIELIKSEYDLKTFSHKNHEMYKVYGSQMGFNEGDPEMLARCVFVSQFLDIYENSFDKTIPDTSYVQPTVNISEELWQARTDYVGNNSAVGKLIGLLIVPDGLSYDHFRLQTDNDQPYGIEIYYFVPSENLSSYDVENSPVLAEFRKNALILLALVDNADYVRAVLTDGERELGFTNGREWADYTMGRDVRDYAESPDKLEELLALKFSNSDSADKGDQALNPTPGQDELYKDRIADWLEDQARATYEPYYEVLDFIISDYREENISDTAGQRVEAIFLYTMISKNYDRDPDTVGYIIEAKENNSPYYQQMYDEYLAPRESNFEFKVIIDANDQMTLYSNISPKGTQWEETVFDDYIMK